MRNVKAWLLATFVAGVLAGLAVPLVTTPSPAAADEKVVVKSHWRHHDGHWSYWDADDGRWYYTDGANWYYHDNDAWNVYRFDKKFGREGFEAGEYKAPGPDVKIVVPRHGIYRPK
jgi:hypothetical protein